MKALKSVIFGMLLAFASVLQAQVSVNLNIGMPFIWGTTGYFGARYYYLPDVEAYYDLSSSMFIYQSGGVWIHRTYLPSRYRNYDLYKGRKVVLTNYYGNQPYTHYQSKGYKYKSTENHGEHSQKYYGVKPGKGNAHRESSNNNGKHEGHGNAGHSKNSNSHGGGKGHKK